MDGPFQQKCYYILLPRNDRRGRKCKFEKLFGVAKSQRQLKYGLSPIYMLVIQGSQGDSLSLIEFWIFSEFMSKYLQVFE